MKLTIALITYNRKMELLEAINSCLPWIQNVSTEFVIIDNASTDGCKEYVERAIGNKVTLKYYYSQTNLGVAGGRNKAFELSTGEYVFFLDDDAKVVTENFFEKLVDKMDNNREVVAADVNIIEPITGKSIVCQHRYEKNNKMHILSYCGCAHILRRDFYEDFGNLYPNKLMFGSEELYASFLAYSNGKEVLEFTELLVNHFPSSINRKTGKERDMDFIVNQYTIKKMTYPIICIPIAKFFYELHKLKRGIVGYNKQKQCNEKIRNRYEKEFVNRMSMGCWINLVVKFGWKVVL